MKVRLGEILIEQGALSQRQVQAILKEQQETHRPFGLICEQMFGIDPAIVEDAWAKQYQQITGTIDPTKEMIDPAAIELITRRQAWQFCVLPLRFDDEELMIATMVAGLSRALRFATNVLAIPSYFVMAEPLQLGQELCRRYALPGMTAESLVDGGVPTFRPKLNRSPKAA